MTPYYQTNDGTIYHGNVLDVLRAMPDESVQMCVTSPPYWGLRDYGIEPQVWDGSKDCEHVWGDELIRKEMVWNSETGNKGNALNDKADRDSKRTFKENSQGQFCQQCGAWRGSLGLEPTPELFIKHMIQIFDEVKRVLRSDGTIWVNMGDSYAHNGACGGSSPDGPRKPRATDKVAQEKMKYSIPPGLKPKDLVGIPWMLAFALRADGWYLRSDIIWHKPNPMPESVTDRPTKAHEYMFLLSKSQKYFYDADAIREPVQPDPRDKKWGNTSQTSRHDHSNDLGMGMSQTRRQKDGFVRMSNPNGRNKRTVWTIPTSPMPEAHFATFPKKLIEPCILAGTSEKGCCVECGAPWERVVDRQYYKPRGSSVIGGVKGCDKSCGWSGYPVLNTKSKTIGWQPTCKCDADTVPCTVLDIFMGSGTSAIVAYRHDRKFVGIELSQTYLDDIAIPRIDLETKQLKLFA